MQYVRDAAIRVCERTLSWRYEQPKFDLTPGTARYAFRKPANTDVHAVFSATVNGKRLTPQPLDDALGIYPEWVDTYTDPDQIAEFGGEPNTITQISPSQFIVLPLPNADETYSVRMVYALKPTRSADGMDATALDELEDTIVHGALQHLLVLPNTNWTDRELAAYHAKQYLFTLTETQGAGQSG